MRVAPGDHQVVAAEHLAQLVAHQLDDAVEAQRAGDALLDGVDRRELRLSLLEPALHSMEVVGGDALLVGHDALWVRRRHFFETRRGEIAHGLLRRGPLNHLPAGMASRLFATGAHSAQVRIGLVPQVLGQQTRRR